MATAHSNRKTSRNQDEDEYITARARGIIAQRTEPRVKHAYWDAGALVLELRDGVTVIVPKRKIPGLSRASTRDLVAFDIEGGGAYLHWDALDVDHSVPVLLADVLGVVTAREVARRAGSVTSPKKAAAAALNGRKGGRPPARQAPSKKRKAAA